MMWNLMKTVISALLVFSAMPGIIHVAAGEEARERLDMAIKATTAINFKSVGHEVFHSSPDSKVIVSYQQLSAPGSAETGFVYRRADYFYDKPAGDVPNPEAAARSMVMNKDGIFAVSAGKAVKLGGENIVYWLPPFDFDNVGAASMEGVTHNGMPCRRIVLDLGANHTLYASGVGKIEVMVNDKSNFIQAWTIYDQKNVPIKTTDFGDVDFANPPRPQAFALRNDLKPVEKPGLSEINAELFAELDRIDLPSPARDYLRELNAAIRKSRTANFRSVAQGVNTQGDPRYTVLYQMYDPDSDFTYQRRDFVPPRFNNDFAANMSLDDSFVSISQSNRRNESGNYQLYYDKAAIKNGSGKNIWYFWYIMEILPASSSGKDFSITRRAITYAGAPCWEYTVKGNIRMEWGPPKQTAMRFMVMRDNDFVCLWEQFGENGEVAEKTSLGIPDFNAEVTADLFAIPDDAEIFEVHNSDEHKAASDKINEEYYYKPMRRERAWAEWVKWWNGIWNWFRQIPGRLFNFGMELNPVYLLVPAAICIPAVIVTKRKGVNKSIKAGRRAGASARRSVAKRR